MKEKIAHLPPFGLRMPPSVRDWVEGKAMELDRSKNWVILKVIEEAMKNEKAGPPTTA